MKKVKGILCGLCALSIIAMTNPVSNATTVNKEVVAKNEKTALAKNTENKNTMRTIKVTVKWIGPKENIIISPREAGVRHAGYYIDFGRRLPGYPDKWYYGEIKMPKYNEKGELRKYSLDVNYSIPKLEKLRVENNVKDPKPNYKITGDIDKGFTVTIINNPKKEEWMYDGLYEMYKLSDGSYFKNGWKNIKGRWYYFDKSGYMVSEKWIKTGNNWYYVGGYIERYTKEENRLYGSMYVDTFTPDGYYVNSSGAWEKGSQLKKDGKGWWLRHDNGSYAKNKWVQFGKKWYYFDESGYLVQGKWVNTDGLWYYMGKSDRADKVSPMYADTFTPDGYYVNSSGAWEKGSQWKYDGKGWWLRYDDGSYARNQWVQFGRNWYYLKDTGYMATNEWIGNWHVNNSGMWDYSR